MCDPRERRSRAAGASGRSRRWHQRSKSSLIPLANFFPKDNSLIPGKNRLHQTMPEEISPDSKCPICLDLFENVAYLDRCWHRFCFRCVLEWSKNKAECPLCKQPFRSIVHSMRSADDYKVHSVRPSEMEAFANPNGRRFRYPTTLTGEHPARVNPQRTSSSRRTMSSPNCGILFEGLSTQTTRQRDAEMHQMIRRLASRRQASLEGRFMRHIQEQEMISFRKGLYRSGTRVRSIEDGGRYRDISAEFFRRNPACLHRLVPWLKRELTVLFGIHGSLINIVQHIIMNNLTKFDLESEAFSNELQPFLLQSTEHFLHEFVSFARCPFNIDAYDEHANYDCPAPSREDGSNSESSIITISPDETETQAPEVNAFRSDTGQAPWDDETPGPSYSNLEQIQASASTAPDSSESSDDDPSVNITELQGSEQANIEVNGDSCDSSDNCVIVDYVKPLAERTPELVQLSSDSDISADDGKKEDVNKVQPTQLRSFSDSDGSRSASPSSAGSKDDTASVKINDCLSDEKRKSKRSEKDENKLREVSSLQSFSSKEASYGYNASKRRKSESHMQHSDREHHSSKRKRKHRSREKRKKKRDGSRHKHKKNKKRSTREKSTSRSLSPSSGSTESRDLSGSRSRSREYSGISRSKDTDYYLRDDYQKNRKRGEYALYSPNAIRGYERLRSRNRSRSRFSSRSRSRSSSRSRSRSSSRSRTSRHPDGGRSEKPGGKRKYKTRHLESTQRGSEETSSVRESNSLKKSLPKDQTICGKVISVADRQPQTETRHKKKKKRSRSPSVEIIYEGVCTSRYDKKKTKRIKSTNPINSSPLSSVVITIDSDSDRENGIKDPEFFNQLPTKRSSLFLRLAQMINGNSHCQLHSPEQDV
ncbi:E3 ubiquitin-protein ligase Topors [Protobothrops mucrosquamatus]|uniref:E3 ubiquitin-protein ligase Topors n=1 Tax=Protobothrops mucrosquamatus TaxID=103944 RepID=UPI000775CDEA|nr:E3 ubiquitin-protein ligase Topors [Protobothrops mucrosquamatus]